MTWRVRIIVTINYDLYHENTRVSARYMTLKWISGFCAADRSHCLFDYDSCHSLRFTHIESISECLSISVCERAIETEQRERRKQHSKAFNLYESAVLFIDIFSVHDKEIIHILFRSQATFCRCSLDFAISILGKHRWSEKKSCARLRNNVSWQSLAIAFLFKAIGI